MSDVTSSVFTAAPFVVWAALAAPVKRLARYQVGQRGVATLELRPADRNFTAPDIVAILAGVVAPPIVKRVRARQSHEVLWHWQFAAPYVEAMDQFIADVQCGFDPTWLRFHALDVAETVLENVDGRQAVSALGSATRARGGLRSYEIADILRPIQGSYSDLVADLPPP